MRIVLAAQKEAPGARVGRRRREHDAHAIHSYRARRTNECPARRQAHGVRARDGLGEKRHHSTPRSTPISPGARTRARFAPPDRSRDTKTRSHTGSAEACRETRPPPQRRTNPHRWGRTPQGRANTPQSGSSPQQSFPRQAPRRHRIPDRCRKRPRGSIRRSRRCTWSA